MVSQRETLSGTSRERLLQSASLEFAASGFDGARVDAIADRARVNKAMLYYHFEDKAALYREVLRDLFESIARRLGDALDAGEAPEARLRAFIRIIADETAARPHFTRIWLREMAESGRHLDTSIVTAISSILGVLATILHEGRARGAFRMVHPLIVQMSIVAPLLLFSASAPTRERFSTLVEGASSLPREAMVEYLERAALAALRIEPVGKTKKTNSRRGRT